MMVPTKKEPAAGVSLTQRLVSGTAWAFAVKALGMVSGLVVNALLARMLAPEEMGAYFLIVSVVMFAAIIAQLGLKQTVVRLVSESIANGLSGRMRAALRSVYGITTIGACIVGGAIYLGAGKWIALSLFDVEPMAAVVGLMSLWVVVLAYQTPVAETFRGFHDIRMATLLDGVLASLLLTLLLGIAWSIGTKVTLQHTVLLSWFAVSVSLVFGTILLYRRVRGLTGEGTIELREVLSISMPLFVTNLATYFVVNGSIWVVGALLTAEDVAMYGAAWKLVNLIMLPLLIVNLVVQSAIAELHAKGQKSQLQNVLRGTATLAGIPALLILSAFLLFGSDILGLVYGEYYRNAFVVLAFLSLGQLANVWSGSCLNVLALTGHQRQLMRLMLVTGFVTLGLAVISAQVWGVRGVAAAIMAGMVIQNGAAWLLVHRLLGLWTHATLSPAFIRQATQKVIQGRAQRRPK